MSERQSLFPSLRTRAIARAEELDFVGYDRVSGPLIRELVAEIDRQEEALKEIASYADNPGRPVLALMAKQALRRG